MFRPHVDAINALEPELEQLSDEALRARTEEFKKQLAEGKQLDDLLVPAFATVREAASGRSANGTSTSSSSAAWCCTKAKSPK